MTQSKHLLSRRTAIGTLIAAPILYFTGKQANDLAADPTGAKNLAPLDPETALTELDAAELQQAVSSTNLPWLQQGGTINDASHLNETAVYGIVSVTSEEEIAATLRFAREKRLNVSISAVRHSMGGQAFAHDALVIDMLRFNKVVLDEANMLITVQPGATWHNIQNIIHPKYAVKAMQSSDIFSVGGSISVNAHGMDHRSGSVGRSIRSMRVMLTDGTIVQTSRDENPELFHLVIGGYGLFGIVLEATLEITTNAIYEPARRLIDYQQFPELFDKELLPDEKLGLFYAHMSTAPQSFLQEMMLYTYEQVDLPDAEIPPLGEVSSTKLRRLVLNTSKLGGMAMRLKWFAEKNIEPRMESCSVVSRNQAMKDGEACLVSRNEPMHDSVRYLQNSLPNETDILHEYFFPRPQFVTFMDGLRKIMLENEVNLLNCSVRVVHKEDNFLNYAPEDAFSVVLYINQRTDAAGHAKMRKVTGELIDLTLQVGGHFFLPYQLYYTPEQLQASYPQINDFFAAKKKYDPAGLLTSPFYRKYGGGGM